MSIDNHANIALKGLSILAQCVPCLTWRVFPLALPLLVALPSRALATHTLHFFAFEPQNQIPALLGRQFVLRPIGQTRAE